LTRILDSLYGRISAEWKVAVCSNYGVGPGSWVVSLWVETSWVTELTIVIFLIQSSLGSLGNSDEVINVKLISEVLIKVVLEVLDQVHMLLYEIVSSNSWEGESAIVEFPGVN
jgi:hypothetical protein